MSNTIIAADPLKQGSSRTADITVFESLARAWRGLFRYDFFISYAWADGRSYAQALASRLSATPYRYRCFIDDKEMGGGERWLYSVQRALRRSAALVLVVSDNSLASENVENEIVTFARNDRRRILPIAFAQNVLPLSKDHVLAPALAKRLHFTESSPLLLKEGAPSAGALDYVANAATFIRSRTIQQGVLGFIATAVFGLLIATTIFFASSVTANTLKQASSIAVAARNERDRGNIVNFLPLVRAGASKALTSETRGLLLDGVLRWPRLQAEQFATFNYPLAFGFSAATKTVVAVDSTKVHQLDLPGFGRVHRPKEIDGIQINAAAVSDDGNSVWLGRDDGEVVKFSLAGAAMQTILAPDKVSVSTLAEISNNWLIVAHRVGRDGLFCLVPTVGGMEQSCQTVQGLSPWKMSVFDSGRRVAVLDEDASVIRTLHISSDGEGVPAIVADPISPQVSDGASVRAFAVTPDGSKWILAGENSIAISTQPNDPGARTETFEGRIQEVAVSKDDRFAAVALEGKGLVVLDLARGDQRIPIETIGETTDGLLRFADDGSALYYIDADGLMTKWDLTRDGRIVTSLKAPAAVVAAGPRPQGGFTVLIQGALPCDVGQEVTVSSIGDAPSGARAPVFSPSGAHYAYSIGGHLWLGEPCATPKMIEVIDLGAAEIVDLAFDGESGLWVLDSDNRLGLIDLGGKSTLAFVKLPPSDAVFTDGTPVPDSDPIRAIAYSAKAEAVMALRADGTTSLIRPWSLGGAMTRPSRWLTILGEVGEGWLDYELIDRSLGEIQQPAIARAAVLGDMGVEAVGSTLNVVDVRNYDPTVGASLRSNQHFGSAIRAVASGSDENPIFVLYEEDGSNLLRLAAVDHESVLAMETALPLSLEGANSTEGMTLDQSGERLLVYNGTTSYRIVDATIGAWKNVLDRIAVLPVQETESRLYGLDYQLLPAWPGSE